MREQRVPTIVVHGEKDLVVPFESAHDMADRSDGALYRVPGAYHSWMLANPRQGADMMRQLLRAELGDVLRDAARAHRITGGDTGWENALLTTDSPLRKLNAGPVDALGTEAPETVELDHLRSTPVRRRGARNRAGARRLSWLSSARRPRSRRPARVR